MNMFKLTTVITAFVLILASSVNAAPINLTFSGNASGSLGGTDFTNSNFVITGFGDTLNVQPFPGFPNSIRILTGSVQIAIDGVGGRPISYTPPPQLSFFSNNGGGGVGFFGLALPPFTDLVIGPTNPVFSTWDMTTSIGPIVGTSDFLEGWTTSTINNSGGRLIFDEASGVPTTFTATELVPLPGAVWLFGSGLLGLMGIMKSCRRSQSVIHKFENLWGDREVSLAGEVQPF